MIQSEDFTEITKKTANYYVDKIKECIESADWISAIRYLKVLAQLMFLADVSDERAMRNRYNVPWLRRDNA